MHTGKYRLNADGLNVMDVILLTFAVWEIDLWTEIPNKKNYNVLIMNFHFARWIFTADDCEGEFCHLHFRRLFLPHLPLDRIEWYSSANRTERNWNEDDDNDEKNARNTYHSF